MSKKILKRSLALGALMAFVITGSAWAGENPTADDYSKKYTNPPNTSDTGHAYGGYQWVSSGYNDSDAAYVGNKVETKKSGTPTAYGGAIYCEGDLTIEDCFFENNQAIAAKAKNAYGGAIAHQKGLLKVTNTWFINNSTSYYKNGSAIYTSNPSEGSKIEKCNFVDNATGSPVWITGNNNSTQIEINDNTFIGNYGGVQIEYANANVSFNGTNTFKETVNQYAIVNKGTLTFEDGSRTLFEENAADIINSKKIIVQPNAEVESSGGINSSGEFELNGNLKVGADSTFTNLSGTNGTFEFLNEGIDVTVTNNTSTGLEFVADGTVNDAVNGNMEELIGDGFDANDSGATFRLAKGSVVGEVTGDLIKGADGYYVVDENSVVEKPHEENAAVSHNANIALMAWRAETNDMNKRLGELRNANGDLGVWARMVGGEDEFKSVEYEYTQYQLGYDEKLSVDPSWTVGVALSYTDGESTFTNGSGENTHKGLSVYGSKLNDDGSFIDLIAKYSRLEHDLTSNGAKGDYSTNGYSVSAEYGKRFQQGDGLWIEPQVELTYGKVKSAEYKLGDKMVSQDAMESLVGRVGFSLGKDIKQGNVYARASYLYDFEGETNMAFTNGATRNFEYDLGGGWWEVGVGANINLSKATYIYADVEKTFGGEVDTNWQWNLGVRYSF